MNSETTLGSVRKASGWSMVWGILMFICGILAIARAARFFGRNCNRARVVDPLRSRLPPGLRLPIAQRRWFSVEITFGDCLRGCRLLHVDASATGRGLSHAPSRYLSRDRRNCGDCFVFQHPRRCERGMGLVRRNCDADPRILDLASLAVELGVGDRNSRRDQFNF